jgi:hypothetical protein
VSDAGRGVQALGKIPHVSDAGPQLWTSSGRTAWFWLHQVAARLERVRVLHGSWDRCLNHHYGGENTAVVLDPPYTEFTEVYGKIEDVAQAVAAWAREHAHLRIALCGHRGDYEMPEWDVLEWERASNTYAGTATRDAECVWFSPACLPGRVQLGLPL